jgi:Regulator of ribonuclease activity B
MMRARMSRCAPLLAILLAAYVGGVSAERLPATLTREQLQQRFTELRASYALDVDGPLRWEFVFAGPDTRAVEALSIRLVADGYRIVTLRADPAADSVLRVARLEQLTPASLAVRNTELTRLAAEHGVRSYHGVEVGPAE